MHLCASTFAFLFLCQLSPSLNYMLDILRVLIKICVKYALLKMI